MHHDVLMVVRGQLVGTGSLIPSCGYQGWGSGGCSFQQVPLPAEPSGSDAWSSTQASCLFNGASGSLECLRYPVLGIRLCASGLLGNSMILPPRLVLSMPFPCFSWIIGHS